MLNTYEHEDAERLARSVAEVIDPVRSLIDRAREDDVPLVYVQDNYGDWNTSAEELGRRAMEGRRPELVEPVLPRADAAFVVKARQQRLLPDPPRVPARPPARGARRPRGVPRSR
jgi:hypothetical protein